MVAIAGFRKRMRDELLVMAAFEKAVSRAHSTQNN
jgi:hypothetical protein